MTADESPHPASLAVLFPSHHVEATANNFELWPSREDRSWMVARAFRGIGRWKWQAGRKNGVAFNWQDAANEIKKVLP